jgi:multimeric flavodoxin WrbA
MQKKILILKGSPRDFGNSSVLANVVAAGAGETGAEVETFSLHKMDIHPCDACDSCLETGGVCVIGDDMQTLYPKLREADGIVLASPIYWFNISAQLKACIDRWYAFEAGEENELSGKEFGIVLTYGDSDPYNSGAVNAIHAFQSMFRYINGKIVGMVYGTASDIGDVEKKPELMEQAYALGKALARVSSGK